MTSATQLERNHGNAYQIFILVLTVMSLVIMAFLLLPLSEPVLDVALASTTT